MPGLDFIAGIALLVVTLLGFSILQVSDLFSEQHDDLVGLCLVLIASSAVLCWHGRHWEYRAKFAGCTTIEMVAVIESREQFVEFLQQVASRAKAMRREERG
jgi:hypothetical protein